MKLIVNEDKCIGCGQCISICDNVYEFNDNNLAKVMVDKIPDDDLDDALVAKDNCPTGAIEEA